MNRKLSVLVPSAYPEKLQKFLANLKETAYDYEALEIVICLDGVDKETKRIHNYVYTYHPPTEFRTKFFEAAYRASSCDWILLANDDILFQTKHWDKLLDLDNRHTSNLLYFKDNFYNGSFACHPVTHRKTWELCDKAGLVFPPLRNMGCDTTLWDVTPHGCKIYLPEIVVQHDREMSEAKDNEIREDYKIYWKNAGTMRDIKAKILENYGVENTRILIGLSTGEYVRRADFIPYLLGMVKPPGSSLTTVHGQSPAEARNTIVKQALKADCTHIFFIDDDMAIPPNTLLDLMSHNKDIVMGLYLMRGYPHRPLAFDERYENGWNRFLSLEPEVEGLIPITNGGLGCALISIEVFKKMPEPWFTLGEIKKDAWCDDVAFFNRATDLGFKMFLDTSTRLGHMATVTVWPVKEQDAWYTSYKYPTGEVKFLQHRQPKPEV